MSDSGVVMVYGNGAALTEPKKSSTFSMKVGLAQMLRGGVIMDVVTPGPRCRGGGRLCRHGARACPCGHPRPRRRRPLGGATAG
ncbi:unnamed protein product [Musa acuminata subsp. malaccensis]|uniref:(wild Malaysian banana) hypothetical protein n=1 Tax=Musa acuminata subsp. malaccensis TaxID=214687 RepID=A0A8D7B1K5_MUSAM|nr:unnamed protein product [Musa acuminata subsp. malaccensis]